MSKCSRAVEAFKACLTDIFSAQTAVKQPFNPFRLHSRSSEIMISSGSTLVFFTWSVRWKRHPPQRMETHPHVKGENVAQTLISMTRTSGSRPRVTARYPSSVCWRLSRTSFRRSTFVPHAFKHQGVQHLVYQIDAATPCIGVTQVDLQFVRSRHACVVQFGRMPQDLQIGL